jgi:hypothetical protein
MNIILNTIPATGTPVKRPDPKDELAYGKYMVNASGCIECHTQAEKGQIIEDLAFSGGREFSFPDGSVLRSANITPDPETGIGKWSKENFIARFKAYTDSSFVAPDVQPGDYNTIMPWMMYGNMTKEDLSAIYAYLRTIAPAKNSIVKFSPAKAAL